MAGIGLLALLDDIASVLDDIALMTKMAAQKTAGVLGDDLALNAQQVAGVAAERELPVVWGVAKGSFVNKLLLIPAALGISFFAPQMITPLLMIGGAYLCYEGAEKLIHHFSGRGKADKTEFAEEPQKDGEPSCPAATGEDLAAFEKDKIKGAIRTDFVLSAEIIVIALGTVPEGSSFFTLAAVVSLIGILMTVGVYGLVAGIVKMDDAGLYLLNRKGRLGKRLGRLLVGASPAVMRLLGIIGTVAMFMVGGGILAHGTPAFHIVTDALAALPLSSLLDALARAVFGILAGLLIALASVAVSRIFALVLNKKSK